MKYPVSSFCSRSLGLCFAFALAGFSVLLSPAVAHAQSCAGVSFSDQLTAGGKSLTLNGLGIRKFKVSFLFQFDVYVAGLYLEQQSRSGSAILESRQVKHLVLRLVRDVNAASMNRAIEQGLRKNAGDDYRAMKDRVAEFKTMMPDLKEGDRLGFTLSPEGSIELTYKDSSRGKVAGDDFGRVFLAVWIGPDPLNAGLKRGLLGGACD